MFRTNDINASFVSQIQGHVGRPLRRDWSS